MNKKEISYAINEISTRHIQEAKNYSTQTKTVRQKKYSVLNKLCPLKAKPIHSADYHSAQKRFIKKAFTLAASFALCLTLLISAVHVQAIYQTLYFFSPQIAQALKPVQMFCEDQGIRMEVLSASISENEADIYISMQDLTADRIDNTIDLFDSYSINRPFSCSVTCNRVDYQAATRTATFLIHFSQFDGQKIEGNKITFTVSCFLSKKQTYQNTLPIDLSTANLEPKTQTEVEIRGYSWSEEKEMPNYNCYLIPSQEEIYIPTPGVSITAIGFLEQKLRIQVYYENIHETDNHGFVTLINSEGNQISCESSVSFWDSNRSGSYEEYIFAISPDEISNYTLYGEFRTSGLLTKGNWQITFPLKSEET